MGLGNDQERPLPPYAHRMCGDCLHWFAIPNPGLELQRVKSGQCRSAPPDGQILNAQQNVAFYRIVPQDFGACSRFKSIVSVGLDRLENATEDE